MNKQISVRKTYKCYTCGEPIIFGNGKHDRRNLDGTVHVCKNTQEEQREHARQQNKSRYNKWFWGYGPGAQYKQYGYYTKEEYKKQREDNYNKYNEWRQQYKQNKDLTLEQAARILELENEIVIKICQLRRNQFTKELIQTIKNAYRRLALMWHPDRNKSAEATPMFRKITEAYEKILN